MFMHEHAKGSAYECYTAHLPLDVSVAPPVSVRSNFSLVELTAGSLIR